MFNRIELLHFSYHYFPQHQNSTSRSPHFKLKYGVKSYSNPRQNMIKYL